MEWSHLVSATTASDFLNEEDSLSLNKQYYYYPTVQEVEEEEEEEEEEEADGTPHNHYQPGKMEYMSPPQMVQAAKPEPKSVCFELISVEQPQYRARLPMRVKIFPHDTTDSIVTTVKNFYGLYSSPTSSKGVSFEDESGDTLIARYENFSHQMTVYVRVTEEPPISSAAPYSAPYHPAAGVAQSFLKSEGLSVQRSQYSAQQTSRPTSRASRRRSPSPNAARGRRSASQSTNTKVTSRSARPRGPGSQVDLESSGYSSGDGAPGSSSGKTKEQIGNTEISLENIVEGGRRKRAKFESSELPLFAPPQMPAAISNPSVSPARHNEQHRASLPALYQGQNPFTNPRPLQSPHSYTNGYGANGIYATPGPDNRHRSRGSIGSYPAASGAHGMGILPTPDPTVGSCMSEEDKDVAIQLMRLGEVSNISHGRTSASTQDDTFSGRADATSSTGATSDAESSSDEEEEHPAARKQRLDLSGNSKKIYDTTESHFLPPSADGQDAGAALEQVEMGLMAAPKLKKIKHGSQNGNKSRASTNGAKARSRSGKSKSSSSSSAKTKRTASSMSGPMSPTSLPVSRKPSISSMAALPLVPGGEEQPDLSSKPRCQRCRKSKKGCDRQRPCARCKDAGIPADQCISEDEGNGRKGRYGRHMGVPLAKDEVVPPPALLPAAPISAVAAPVTLVSDKNKKRKR